MKKHSLYFVSKTFCASFRPGRFPGIAGNARNHGNNRKFNWSGQRLYQTKRYINKLCLGKISLQTTVSMKLSVVSGFSNMLYCIKGKPGNAGNRQKAF